MDASNHVLEPYYKASRTKNMTQIILEVEKAMQQEMDVDRKIVWDFFCA